MHAPRPLLFVPALLVFVLLTSALPMEAGAGRWTPTGPEAGVVTALAVAPSRPSTVYASVGPGKIYRSTDRGNRWTRTGNFGDEIHTLHVDAGRPEVLFALNPRNLYRSRNGGATWELLRPDVFPFLVQTHPSVPGHVYVADADGSILFSRNGGATWRQFRPAFTTPHILLVDPSARTVLYAAAGSSGGIYKSSNSGARWTFLGQGLTPDVRVEALAIDPSSPDTLYLVQSSDNPDRRLFESRDGGESWSPIPTNLGPGAAGNLVVEGGRQPVFYLTLDQRPYRSTDGGRTWTELALPEPAWSLASASYGLLAGTVEGVFRSVDQGASWKRSSRGLRASWVVGMAIHPTLPLLYVADAAGFVFKSPDGGRRWHQRRLPSSDDPRSKFTGPLILAPSRPATVYLGILEGTLWSTNGGRQWARRAPFYFARPSSLAVDPADDSTLYLAAILLEEPFDRCFLFKSTDSGATWDCLGDGFQEGGAEILAADLHRPGVLYAVKGKSLFRSEDGGLSWSLVFDDFNPLVVGVLALSPAAPDVMFAGLPDRVARSTDGGRTWNFHTEGLPERDPVVALAPDPVDASTLYAATSMHGVFKSTDGGRTWARLGQVLEGTQVTTLVLDPRDRATLYVGTVGDGVWTLTQ